MFVGTHTALPVILATGFNGVFFRRKGRLLLRTRHLAAVALGGILPDLVWPHLSLHARLTSWSHTVWFLAGVLVLLIALGRRYLQPDWKFAVLATWLAVFLHLGVDTVSGGTSPLYPFGHRIGFSTISFHSWIFVDVITVPVAALAFLWTHRRSRVEGILSGSGSRKVDSPPCEDGPRLSGALPSGEA